MIATSLKLPPFDPETGVLNLFIETPKGSRNKYVYDNKSGLMKLKKLLPRGMIYPFDFGFVPGTLAEDGDPLDVLLLGEGKLFPGCLVKGRLLGALKAQQRKKGKTFRNDRLIAIPVLDPEQEGPSSFRELKTRLLKDVECFFVLSHRFEGTEFTILGRTGAKEAVRLVRRASRAFLASQRKPHQGHGSSQRNE